EDTPYTRTEMDFQKGDKLFLFTDGIFEEFNDKEEEFGEERLYKVIQEFGKESPASATELIYARMNEFLGKIEKQDDITFIAIAQG
ncbi:MAG: serine/threonine-protein phosphatase, partial [Leptospira sp.]|nr:serine/threonine-protein phosphatase [Leptospira sp.]